MASINYYEILGIPSDASEEEIKSAYRRLVKQYHPDTSRDPETTARFIELNTAYEVLLDPQQRTEYDEKIYLRLHKSSTEVARAGRRFVFPHYLDVPPVVIFQQTLVYSLTNQNVHILYQHNLLRGIAPTIENLAYYCHRCQHCWIPASAKRKKTYTLYSRRIPCLCPACSAPDWYEFLLLCCLHCTTIFESEGPLREQLSGQQTALLFGPYDLFPRCPYCKQSHWCASEETHLAVS